jgi:hypothetical protein
MEKTNKVGQSSFHGGIITATVQELTYIFGDAQYKNNDGKDKINYQWYMKDTYGLLFTLYDMKYYRPLTADEVINWHIGCHSKEESDYIVDKVQTLIKNTFPTLFPR